MGSELQKIINKNYNKNKKSLNLCINNNKLDN